MLWKLLRKNISPAQIVGYALANLIGLAIVVAAVQFYSDASAALRGSGEDGAEGLIPAEYIVISRPVSLANTLGSRTSAIPQRDIDRLSEQPWVRSVGAFTAASFPVAASVEFQGRGMSTHMFLEAIPDKFIDIAPAEWAFDAPSSDADLDDIEVPIIVAKDYLALYNFGFAATRGLPQLSENLISQVPLTLYMRGAGHHDSFRARIVGFSSRLNTIAVPQAFIDWANARYAGGAVQAPSRLIVEVADMADPAIDRYLEANGFEAAGDHAERSRAFSLLRIATGIVASVGAVITALALFILILSISLLLQRNGPKIALLSLLGYGRGSIAACYIRLVGVVNASVLALAVVAGQCAARLWQASLADMGMQATSPWLSIAVALGLMLIITAINIATIMRLVRRAAR